MARKKNKSLQIFGYVSLKIKQYKYHLFISSNVTFFSIYFPTFTNALTMYIRGYKNIKHNHV